MAPRIVSMHHHYQCHRIGRNWFHTRVRSGKFGLNISKKSAKLNPKISTEEYKYIESGKRVEKHSQTYIKERKNFGCRVSFSTQIFQF